MNDHRYCTGTIYCLRAGILALAMVMASLAHATTFWTGPNINFVKLPATPSDTVLPGKVVLTRGNNEVLYNTAAGESSAGTQSPKGTMWALGNFTNHTPFQTMFSMRNGNLGALLLSTNVVMWITNDDIFVSLKFTVWGEHGIANPTNGVIGCFAYTRSTAPAVAPTVAITNPAPNAVFAAPANLNLGASASGGGGTVTNVSFFNSTTPLGSVQSSPFNLTVSNQPAGSYALTAVATAAGVSATSPVVNITVVTPVAVNLTSPQITGGSFSFNYSANVGLRYVVERSSDLFNWTKILTNVAGGNPASFSEGVSNPGRFYRVGRLPNP